MRKCPVLAGMQSSLGLTQCFERVRKEAVWQNVVKGPLADPSPVCYRYDAPGAVNPPSCDPLGASAPGSPAFHLQCWHSYRLRRPAGCLSKPVLHDISRPVLTRRGVHERCPPAPARQDAPAAGRAHSHLGTRGQMWHLCSLSALQHPCQVTSDQNQLLCALWSRSWVISDGDYISVGEHLS